jgi:cobalamin synthase
MIRPLRPNEKPHGHLAMSKSEYGSLARQRERGKWALTIMFCLMLGILHEFKVIPFAAIIACSMIVALIWAWWEVRKSRFGGN